MNGHPNNQSNGTAHLIALSRRHTYGDQLSSQNPLPSPLAYSPEAPHYNMDTDGAFPQGMAYTAPPVEYQMPSFKPRKYISSSIINTSLFFSRADMSIIRRGSTGK